MPYAIIKDGQPLEVFAGQPFVTSQFKVGTDAEAAWSFSPIGSVIAYEASHSAAALQAWDANDRDRWQVHTIVDTPSPPDGLEVATRTLSLANGTVTATYTYRDIPAPPVPAEVSMMQARLALLQTGHLDAVEAAIDAADPATKVYWATAPTLHRNHPLVATLAAAVNLTSPQVDALFTAAAAIT